MDSEIKFPKISQSMIKAYNDCTKENQYERACAKFFYERYISKNPLTETLPTEAMELGIYFEYLATGALPKSNIVPKPVYSYFGTARQCLSAPYKRVEESVQYFKEIFKHYNIKILKSGMLLETQTGENGVVDIYAEWDGKKCFIDLKYSGLIDDRWSEMGWHIDSLPTKEKILLQGVHYKYLAKQCLGIDDIDFYFFVFDSANPRNVRIIKEDVTETLMMQHLKAIQDVKEIVDYAIKAKGLKAVPQLKRCNACPLRDTCEHAMKFPPIDVIVYGEGA